MHCDINVFITDVIDDLSLFCYNVQVAGWSAAGGHEERFAAHDILLSVALARSNQSPRAACSSSVRVCIQSQEG